MKNIVLCIYLSILSLTAFAEGHDSRDPLYQIDLIVFTHQQDESAQNELLPPPLLAPDTNKAINLEAQSEEGRRPYHLLPKTSSLLKSEYWALSQNDQYQIIFEYSWLQPEFEQKPIALPKSANGVWEVDGTIRVKLNNYFQFDSELLFASLANKHETFIFNHSQKLKEGMVYYFDHPVAGMIVKISRVS